MRTAILATKKAPAACLHCGLDSPMGTPFCCPGCETVFQLLHERGLAHFYDLRDNTSFRKPAPAPTPLETSSPFPGSASAGKMDFYIEGIHCLGCLWLLEKLPEIDRRIAHADLDLAHNILKVELNGSEISWPEVVRLLRQLGYVAKPLEANEGEAHQKADQRLQLSRLGVAAFCSGNIMLLSVSTYAGADAWWSRNFSFLSLLLAVPALTFSAWPIYRSAYLPLLKGRLSSDLAIAMALIAGVAMSLWNLSLGRNGVFFDSITMLVFLLLTSRTILARLQYSISKENPCLRLLQSDNFLRLGPPEEQVRGEQLGKGDVLMLSSGQLVPADCVLLEAGAYFDLSLLTGESEPVKILAGNSVDAGATLVSGKAKMQCLRMASESRLAKIMKQADSLRLRRSPILDFADKVGRYFVVTVLALAILTVILMPNAEGVMRALALVIVTCPCVLAFAVPLAMTRAMQVAAGRGILFRGADKLEALATAKNLFFDKTGTLTSGHFEVLEWVKVTSTPGDFRSEMKALEAASLHPVAKAIVRFLSNTKTTLEVSNFKSVPGFGVQGWIHGREWKLTRLPEDFSVGHNGVGLYREDELMVRVTLGDRIRPEARKIATDLQSQGINLCILSGDSETNVAETARETGIHSWYSRLLPEQKAALVLEKPGSIMVGDGANDAVAFQGAAVGIAMQGSMDLGLQNSDVLLTKPGLDSLLKAVRIAKRARSIVRGNFAVTLGYNLFAGALAMSGHMSPLLAAILMPLSAISVFAATWWRTTGGRL